jgi:hypothetical protein
VTCTFRASVPATEPSPRSLALGRRRLGAQRAVRMPQRRCRTSPPHTGEEDHPQTVMEGRLFGERSARLRKRKLIVRNCRLCAFASVTRAPIVRKGRLRPAVPSLSTSNGAIEKVQVEGHPPTWAPAGRSSGQLPTAETEARAGSSHETVLGSASPVSLA